MLSHADGCGAELGLPTAPWVGWERTEGQQREEQLQLKVKIKALQAEKKGA